MTAIRMIDIRCENVGAADEEHGEKYRYEYDGCSEIRLLEDYRHGNHDDEGRIRSSLKLWISARAVPDICPEE